MDMYEFAKYIGMDKDEFFALTYKEANELARKHGYEFTGDGIFPIVVEEPDAGDLEN